MSSIPIGAHVDQADPVAEARARSADVAQFFLGDPQGWKAPAVAYTGGAAALRAAAEAAGLGLYVHAPYVINVATANNRIRIPSRKLLQQTVHLAAEVGARGVIVHGGHLAAKDDPDIGYDNWQKAVDRTELSCPLLLENTAGGDNAMARTFDRLARTWEAIAGAAGADRVGFCLDTCHAHAGGEELATVVERVRAITGRIDLVHANDSRDPFGSGRDRHANLGHGEISPPDMVAVVRAAGAPVLVETPDGGRSDTGGQRADIAWLRERLGEDPDAGPDTGPGAG